MSCIIHIEQFIQFQLLQSWGNHLTGLSHSCGIYFSSMGDIPTLT